MSEPTTFSAAVAELFEAFPSFVAPVVPVSVELPIVVGVPLTVHEIVAPGATSAGGAGVQIEERPAGNPEIAHDALEAAIAGDDAFVHV